MEGRRRHPRIPPPGGGGKDTRRAVDLAETCYGSAGGQTHDEACERIAWRG